MADVKPKKNASRAKARGAAIVRPYEIAPIRSYAEIMRGFPEAPRGPTVAEIEAGPHDELLERVIDQEWRHYAHEAVHGGDPFFRDLLIKHAIDQLYKATPPFRCR